MCFVKKQKKKKKKKSSLFLSKRRTGLFAEVFEESYEKAWSSFVLPSTCSSLVLFLDFLRWSFITNITASPVPHLFFTPDSSGGMYGRAGEDGLRGREKRRQRETQGEWSLQKKIKFTVRESRRTMSEMYHMKPRKHSHRETHES